MDHSNPTDQVGTDNNAPRPEQCPDVRLGKRRYRTARGRHPTEKSERGAPSWRHTRDKRLSFYLVGVSFYGSYLLQLRLQCKYCFIPRQRSFVVLCKRLFVLRPSILSKMTRFWIWLAPDRGPHQVRGQGPYKITVLRDKPLSVRCETFITNANCCVRGDTKICTFLK